MKVPAIRSNADSGELEVAFALSTRNESAKPSLGTIMVAEGGPGYAATNPDSARAYVATFGSLLDRRDLLLIDQRGTGLSEPVRCPGLQREDAPEMVATAECANQLGDNAFAYTTAESAEDIEVIREALDISHATLYGDSYGTLLSQAYAVRYGDRLDSIVLSSAYPADDPFWRSIYPAALRAVRVSCERDPACEGNAADRFRKVLGRLRGTGRPFDDLLAYLLEAGTYAPNSYRELNAAISDRLNGSRQPLADLTHAAGPGQGPASYFSAGMAEAVSCNDYPVPWDRSLDFDRRVGQLDQAITDFPDRHMFKPLSVREWMLSPSTTLASCLAWPPPIEGMEPPVPEGDLAPAGLPALVMSGEFDDITTVAEARQVAKQFPDSTVYIVPDRGHASELYYPFRSPAAGRIREFIAAH